MPNVVLMRQKRQSQDKALKVKIYDFLDKLQEDDTTKGLHIEKMQGAVDSRARTARIDKGIRAVLYVLETKMRERTWVFAGAWAHDTAIERARTLRVDLNSVNGAVQLVRATAPHPATSARPAVAAAASTRSHLAQFNYSQAQLVEMLGFDESDASALLAATSEDEVLALAEAFENDWQTHAALALAMGDALDAIREDLGLAAPEREVDGDSDDERIVRAFAAPASRMQFAMIDDDEELRRILEDGDFGAWRTFLHPEQRQYVERDFNGPFRLTGAAGTGKTVVLLHRARRLHLAAPESAIVLTTFTRALAENLKRDLKRLDPSIVIAKRLGDAGVHVAGVDQLSIATRSLAATEHADAAQTLLGRSVTADDDLVDTDDAWLAAVKAIEPTLPAHLLRPSFFEQEYVQAILPARVVSAAAYAAIRRPGRGVALDRRKRAAVWSVVERFRADALAERRVTFAEAAELAAMALETRGGLIDHVLVDEGQDFSPSHWRLLRALTLKGRNDLFLAEDAHQRIYGLHVPLSRHGIAIIGRSKRLTLNYRTTAQNLSFAMRTLVGESFIDAEGADVEAAGYRSARLGPIPSAFGADAADELLDALADLIREWESEDPDASVGVLARSNLRAQSAATGLQARGIAAAAPPAPDAKAGSVIALTMHKAKGLEFQRVVLYDVSDGVVPSAYVLDQTAPEDRADAELRERSLLYVASTRARDVLVVTWIGTPSPFLDAHDFGE